jgi:hypothetical protein
MKTRYGRVIRLEGQINIIKDILLFTYSYQPHPVSPTELALTASRTMYFEYINQLITKFLDRGFDLAHEAKNTENFLRLMKFGYFDAMPEELQEKEEVWPYIWWFTRFQEILEDTGTGLEEAILKGWKWFIDPNQYPAKYGGAMGFANVWESLDAVKKTEFLGSFSIDQQKLGAWASSLKDAKIDFGIGLTKQNEAIGMANMFHSAGMTLDFSHPKVKAPDSTNFSECLLCYEKLKKENSSSEVIHRPVQTACGHVFGYSCLRSWFAKEKCVCPKCYTELDPGTAFIPPIKEVLESADRELKWLQSPIAVENPQEPHDFVSKLALIFEPADEIKEHLSLWSRDEHMLPTEANRLMELGLYLARERLEAVFQKDKAAWRRIGQRQVEVAARMFLVRFLLMVLPQ